MPSLIPGYEYDIFISYRQKDNKNDGWVTEFVDHLKRELESTFKEEISLYFDLNPHNGILETHDVDDSLKQKLKCLIFIPVISRVYCDPGSFAWKYEFKVFAEQASQDRFGLKIKLPNGNVASRILPVRIHDLEIDDIRICELILGGVLRCIDFIYRSPGVNRPLQSHEDHPQDNLNKSYYRDQINKVANAIEEILRGLKRANSLMLEENITLKEEAISDTITASGVFFDYSGSVDHITTGSLLKKLKRTKEFENLNKTTGKKVYAIVSECLDNISKYSFKEIADTPITQPYLSIAWQDDKIIIRTGNPVDHDKIIRLDKMLKQINKMDEETLKASYDEKINQEWGKDENSAGLGFILMALKSGNCLDYNFTGSGNNFSLFDLRISVNKYIGRKLIIDETSWSPKVIFDPEENHFEISGESRPPDVPKFYEPILSWSGEFFGHYAHSDLSQDPIVFDLNFDYFNSSSGKYILDFCKQIAVASSKGINVSIRWNYEEDDMDMLEAGKELSRISKFPFEYVQKAFR